MVHAKNPRFKATVSLIQRNFKWFWVEKGKDQILLRKNIEKYKIADRKSKFNVKIKNKNFNSEIKIVEKNLNYLWIVLGPISVTVHNESRETPWMPALRWLFENNLFLVFINFSLDYSFEKEVPLITSITISIAWNPAVASSRSL